MILVISPDDFSYSSSRIIRKIQANEGQYVKLDYALLVPSTKFDLSNLKNTVYLLLEQIYLQVIIKLFQSVTNIHLNMRL